MSVLEVNHVKKVYKTRMGTNSVTALKDVHFSVERGEFVAIMGESGSGKTTLLNILASLDVPTAGKVLVDGKDFSALKDGERAIMRRNNLGFIFQDFNLLDNFTIEDNIKLPLVLAGEDYKTMDAKVAPANGNPVLTFYLGKKLHLDFHHENSILIPVKAFTHLTSAVLTFPRG